MTRWWPRLLLSRPRFLLSNAMNAAAKTGMDYYVSKGLSVVAAAAIIGAFTVESKLNPYAVGDTALKDHAHGVGQWRGNRWANAQHLAKLNGKSPYNYLLQLEFAL